MMLRFQGKRGMLALHLIQKVLAQPHSIPRRAVLLRERPTAPVETPTRFLPVPRLICLGL